MRKKIAGLLCGISLAATAQNSQEQAGLIWDSYSMSQKLSLLFVDTTLRSVAAREHEGWQRISAVESAVSIPSKPKALLLANLNASAGSAAVSPQALHRIPDKSFVASYLSVEYPGSSGWFASVHHQNWIWLPVLDHARRSTLREYGLQELPLRFQNPIVPGRTFDSPSIASIHLNSTEQAAVAPNVEELLKQPCLFVSSNIAADVFRLRRAIEMRQVNWSLLEVSIREIFDALYAPALNGVAKGQVSPALLRDEALRRGICGFAKPDFSLLTDLSHRTIGLFPSGTASDALCLDAFKRYTQAVQLAHPSVLHNIATMPWYVVVAPNAKVLRTAAEMLREIKPRFDAKTIVLYAGDPEADALQGFDWSCFDAVLCGSGASDRMTDWMIQALMGGAEVAKADAVPDNLRQSGFRSCTISKTRLGYGTPEQAGMSLQVLNRIDLILNEMISRKAAPGAQVWVVRKGMVVYEKVVGKDLYAKGHPVEWDHLYDLASVTKVIGTLPLVMRLFDRGVLTAQTPLGSLLEQARQSNKADLTLAELLLHQAGLPAFIPFYLQAVDSARLTRPMYSGKYSREYPVRVDTRLYQLADVPYNPLIFRAELSDTFSIRVAEGMYMNQFHKTEILRQIYADRLRNKTYRYSDVGYYLLQQVVERLEHQTLDRLFDSCFAQPMGAQRLVFKPLERYRQREVIPTEEDLYFRKELLRGYVHDPGAAMMGGVAGHAGLFGNANDLAKMAQMYLNNGFYGGKQYLDSATIAQFTRVQIPGNRRGLGFDKPDPSGKASPCSDKASPSSYGHSGFTGTFVWIDPREELIYIFLSNRVHPKAFNKALIQMNVRSRIQSVVYEAIVSPGL